MSEEGPELPEGYSLARFGEIDSTNLEAVRRAERGESGPLWIWAEQQLAGRGRMGRSWVSETGNLYATLLLPLNAGERASDLSFVTVLSVCDAAVASLPDEAAGKLMLKWPNDLLLDGEKAAGILLEQAGSGAIAIGCGLNLGNVPASGLRRPATGLALHGASVTASSALAHLAKAMDHWLRIWRRSGFGTVRQAWLARAAGQGQVITVSQGEGTLQGTFKTLDDMGALILELPDGCEQRILAADIEFGS
ncbi:MAG: biotin--[acetyl-CoA-carboxylase] ligase [Pseudomonadota bacterium]